MDRAGKFFETHRTQRIVELKMKYLLWSPAPSKPTIPQGSDRLLREQ